MRSFTTDQLNLISGGRIRVRLLMTIYMNDGIYYFCDDVYDVTDGVNTYIGASALLSATDIKSATGLSAESVTLTIDGNRLSASGFSDPAGLFRDILGLNYTQRRITMSLGLSWPESQQVTLEVPMYSGLINTIKVTDPSVDMIAGTTTGDVTGAFSNPQGTMTVVLDSIAIRYSRGSYRTRSHADQLDICAFDMFFSFVDSVVENEHVLYWGALSPLPEKYVGTPYNQFPGTIPPGGVGGPGFWNQS